ncbi:hypothetical protein LFAB_16925 [Lactiplantibacillus fabifermentans T30PCM01]|uniref:Uncharacterized protein n=1 Tax=Lactiplantibacillus fabifermentans T30PCM01 TaxID=1400520 RepID=W6T3Y1_9LACO|nr:hypothetical protein LFAB_16925 [Lactiplantibacillus fabifermentans T30PCM01]
MRTRQSQELFALTKMVRVISNCASQLGIMLNLSWYQSK